MKKAILILSIAFIGISVKSQVFETWSAPLALTDTLSFNSNPEVLVFDSGDSFIFYEKRQSQSGNSEIWWKKISGSMSDEQMLIGGYPEVDYRNPKFIHNNFLVFECNATNNGNYDIFGVKLDEFGLIGNSFKLTNTEYDENSFYATNYLEICCWESEGDIIVANIESIQDTLQFTNIEIIDTTNCFDPVCKSNFIAWRKVEDNESHIFYSEIDWPSTEWSDPDTIIQTNDNVNLSLSRSIYGLEGYNLCWQDSNSIYFAEPPVLYLNISSPDIPGIDYYYEPTAFDLIFLADNLPILYSFAGETASIRDIYIMDEMFSSDVINITDDSLINKNPKMFFGGEYGYFYDVFNIWQTEINGFDVLFMSTASYLFGAINENPISEIITVFPNPVTNQATIKLSFLKENGIENVIQIYNINGLKVDEIKFGTNQEFIWDKGNLPSGVYYLVVKNKKGSLSKKIIIL